MKKMPMLMARISRTSGTETIWPKAARLNFLPPPSARRTRAAGWLVMLGRYTCKARKLDGPQFLVRDLCAFEAKTGT